SDYEFTYSINGGTPLTVATNGSSSVTVSVPTDVAGTFEYELLSVEDITTGCSQPQSGTATVLVNPLPTATISGDTVVCQNGTSPVITFTGTGGTSDYEFTYSINGGTPLTVATNGSSSATESASTHEAGTFEDGLLSVEDITTGCSQPQSGTATVLVHPFPTRRSSGLTVVCQNGTSPVITFTGTGGTSDYEFTYSINGGTPLTVATNGSSSVTVSVPTDVAGTFEYELLSVEDVTTGCSQPQSGTATVLVNPLPTPTSRCAALVCQNGTSPVITFTGAGGTSDYEFT